MDYKGQHHTSDFQFTLKRIKWLPRFGESEIPVNANKMDVFRVSKKVLRFSTFYWNRNESLRFKFLTWTSMLLMLSVMQFVFWSGWFLAVELIGERSTDTRLITYVIAEITSTSTEFYSILALLFRKNDIRDLFDMIQATVSSSKKNASAVKIFLYSNERPLQDRKNGVPMTIGERNV